VRTLPRQQVQNEFFCRIYDMPEWLQHDLDALDGKRGVTDCEAIARLMRLHSWCTVHLCLEISMTAPRRSLVLLPFWL
jgi:hypothetical protein